jgi:multiple sugar transport system permease protein
LGILGGIKLKSDKTRKPIYIFLIFGSLIMLLPFVWMILTSFKDNSEIITKIPPTFLPDKIYLGGYEKVFSGAPFIRWLFNSLVVAFFITGSTIFTSALVGYIYAKFEFIGKKVTFFMILATLMIPFEVIMIPEYMIISRLGMLNSLKALVIPSLVSAFGIFLCKQFCEGIPNDLIDAGRIDGATEFTIFSKLIVPEIKPALSALTIFTFMGSWNNYMWPLIVINDINKMPASLAIDFFNGMHRTQPSTVISASVLILIPILIVYLIFQKQFIEGLTLTGMK